MSDLIEISQGQDWTVEYRIRAGDGRGKPISVTLAADAATGDTALVIKGDHPALASDDVLLLGEDTVVVLSAGCAVGVTALAVTALAGSLKAGDVLAKLQDLTGYIIGLEVLASRGDATPLLAVGDTTVTLATQAGTDRGKVQVAGLQSTAAVAALLAGSYYFALWRRNSGTARTLAEGDFRVLQRGFL